VDDGSAVSQRERRFMKSWDLRTVSLRPHSPEILLSSDDARAVVLEIPAGESLKDHQVHERAWVTVIDGEVEITTARGEIVSGGSGLTVAFAPGERHAVLAHRTARLLLLLTPWPGDGHPGTMSLEEKATVRQRAAEHRGRP
jgi:quercetin dioxygenase-like cupin family protein